SYEAGRPAFLTPLPPFPCWEGGFPSSIAAAALTAPSTLGALISSTEAGGDRGAPPPRTGRGGEGVEAPPGAPPRGPQISTARLPKPSGMAPSWRVTASRKSARAASGKAHSRRERASQSSQRLSSSSVVYHIVSRPPRDQSA